MLLASIISLLLLSGPAKQTPGDSVYVHEATLHFRWDKSEYEDTYLQNSDAAEKLCNFLESLGEDRIDSVSVMAYASPEGVYEHNMKLSRDRAKQFRVAMEKRMAMDGLDVKLRVRPGGEAWEQLRMRVAADSTVSEVARERILSILDDDSIGRDTKKWRMMHNALGATRQEGDVYHWLLLNHYRYLRCLHIKIYTRDHWVNQAFGLEEAADKFGQDGAAVQGTGTSTGTSGTTTGTTGTADTDSTAVAPADTTAVAPVDTTAVRDLVDEQKTLPAVPDQPAVTKATRGTPIIGLSTNLIYDATYIPHYGFTSIPSFSLEYYPAGGHWTYGADVEWSHWLHYPEHRFNQIHNITLHTRRYFKTGEEGFKGLYLLGSLNAAQYGLGWNQKGWEGEGLGLSAGVGYKWNFGRFFIDLGGSLGAFYSGYDPYVWGNDATGWYYYDYAGDPAKFVPRRLRWFWFGPTRLQVSIGFDLFSRKR